MTKRRNKVIRTRNQNGDKYLNDCHVNVISASSQESRNKNDLEGMKQWVDSLTFESFTKALEFTFHADGHDKRGLKKERHVSNNSPCVSRSTEYDLLLEMVLLQYPVNMSSQKDAGSFYWYGLGHPSADNQMQQISPGTDECDWYYLRRKTMKSRLESTCVFRWVDTDIVRESSWKNHLHFLDDLKQRPTDSDQKQTTMENSQNALNPLSSLVTELPPDLLDVLTKAGVKRSIASLVETFNEVNIVERSLESPLPGKNLSHSVDNCSTCPFKNNHCLVARHAVTFDGSVLDMTTTSNQIVADQSIMLWTSLYWDKDLHASGSDCQNLSTKVPRCRLYLDGSIAGDRLNKKRILDVLRIASKGKFLSMSKNEQYYFAPWFDPTKDWFSLPLYLSSRFEAALWEAYGLRNHKMQSRNNIERKGLIQSISDLDDNSKFRVLSWALGTTIKKILARSHHAVGRATNEIDDYKLFMDSMRKSVLVQTLWRTLSNHSSTLFATIPLLEWGTPCAELKLLVIDHLEDGLSRELDRIVMESLVFERDIFCSNNKSQKTKRKKKNQSQIKYQRSSHDLKYIPKVEKNRKELLISSNDDEAKLESNIDVTQSDNSPTLDSNILDSQVAFPKPESNFENFSVGTVIDGILSEVLKGEILQSTRNEAIANSNLFKQQILDKTLSAPVFEDSTITVISNRVIPDEVTNALQQNDGESNVLSSGLNSQTQASRNRREVSESGSHPFAIASTEMKQRYSSTALARPHLNKCVDYLDVNEKKFSSTMCDTSQVGTYHNQSELSTSNEDVSPSIIMKDNSHWAPSDCSPLFPEISKDETSIFDGAPLCLSGALDGWNSVASQRQNESDLFLDLLEEERNFSDNVIIGSSTAASLGSSQAQKDDPCLDNDGNFPDFIETEYNKAVHFERVTSMTTNEKSLGVNLSSVAIPPQWSTASPNTFEIGTSLSESHSGSPSFSGRSLTPPAPPTPPPQLSPILVSLADLGKLRKDATVGDYSIAPKAKSSVRSLFDSPVCTSTIARNISRDDIRSIDERRRLKSHEKDQHQRMKHPQVDALLSYRNVVAQSVQRKTKSQHSHDEKNKIDEVNPIITQSIKDSTTSVQRLTNVDIPSVRSSFASVQSYKEPILNKILHLDVACARSECALEGVEDASHCNVIPRAHTDDTMTKDGATTISSENLPPEEEPAATLKEERNSYRDICLILGAENAKLRNILASRMCAPLHHSAPFASKNMTLSCHPNPCYEIQFAPMYKESSFRHLVAMSDAGAHRGEHESLARSEDETDLLPSINGVSENLNMSSRQTHEECLHTVNRRISGGGNYAESDTSMEHNLSGQESHAFSSFRYLQHQDSFFGPVPFHGMQSRLSQDILRFIQATNFQLKKNEHRRVWAMEQITKAVNAVWPRAQIKMYGSHMTRLCLPSSDMDFVICLPAVHKNAPAVTPGDLEGRNAINETNQKVLSRKLKGESWLDQRSIKVIERTAVPVIKVSTKDTRTRVVQLDLSFDAKEHHGLEALDMIQHILEETPLIRPLVLVLKQFLLDRGLLTSYTGGLSSYCLFLMVARYCQEQSPTWNDCGSLLMGLLDFYGNFFDPRMTGISVRTKQYFSRTQNVVHTPSIPLQNCNEGPGWTESVYHQFPDLIKRHSFSDKSHSSTNKLGQKPPRFMTTQRPFSFQSFYHTHALYPGQPVHHMTSYQSGKPYTFDPIWVEDPLNPGNNVGRNAFRIFQVLRAFSDAHRALVAALEWDMGSTNNEFGDDVEYPLLKCLLQNQDVFFPMDT